jgi:hypothetical protein
LEQGVGSIGRNEKRSAFRRRTGKLAGSVTISAAFLRAK